MPRRSRLWAKERSTISARSLKASRATPDLRRTRLLVTARRAAKQYVENNAVFETVDYFEYNIRVTYDFVGLFDV
jgi:GH18 family chitinase